MRFFQRLFIGAAEIDPLYFAGFLQFFRSKKYLDSFLRGRYGVVMGSFTLFLMSYRRFTLP